MSKLVALVALLLLVPSATAVAQTKKRTVPATVVFQHGQNPTDPGNCSAIVFVQWAATPGLKVTNAVAHYTTTRGPDALGLQPPFNDVYEWVKTYTAPPGTHWISVGKSWGDGPKPNDCSEMNEKHKTMYQPQATVELSIDNSVACNAARKKAQKAYRAIATANAKVFKAKSAKAKRRARAAVKKAKTAQKKAEAAAVKECSAT